LIPAAGKSMLDWTLEALKKSAFNEIVVNAHHHAEQIEEWVDSNNGNPKILLSKEEEILGTGGGIRQAGRKLHGNSPVLIHNADIWTDFDLKAVYDSHNPDDLVTLLVKERKSSSHLLVDEQKRVVGLSIGDKETLATQPVGEYKKYGFYGIHVASPELFEKLGAMDEFSIINAYLKLIESGETIRALPWDGAWFDMGTEEKLKTLEDYIQKR